MLKTEHAFIPSCIVVSPRWSLLKGCLSYSGKQLLTKRDAACLIQPSWMPDPFSFVPAWPNGTMSTFGYRRELSKYEDIDEDELLASLTEEELKELERELEDIEPDRNLPVGQRQKSLTEKTPTGTFSREALMAYWERETRKLLEKERLGACDKVRPWGVRCFLEMSGLLLPWLISLAAFIFFLSLVTFLRTLLEICLCPLKHRELAQRILAPSLEVHYKLSRKQKKILQKLLLVIKKWAGIQF